MKKKLVGLALIVGLMFSAVPAQAETWPLGTPHNDCGGGYNDIPPWSHSYTSPWSSDGAQKRHKTELVDNGLPNTWCRVKHTYQRWMPARQAWIAVGTSYQTIYV